MASNPRMTRRRFLKWVAGSGLAAAAAAPAYSYYVERNWVEVNTVAIPMFDGNQKHPFRGTRIVHFSDVHFGYHFDKDDLIQVINRIERLKPDLICFTGDLVDDGTEGLSQCTDMMMSLQAPLGKFAVLGNHDYGIEGRSGVSDFWKKTGFRLLLNRHAAIEKGGSRLIVAGVDDLMLGQPDLERALGGTLPEDKVILLAHEPDFADTAADWPQVKLQLSGHTHGGQIRLPFIGHLIAPPHGKKYVDGLYHAGAAQLPVYTNRGIGTTTLPIRFWCRPELTVLELT
ncbi:metallophosphoesterase [Paenibacillus spongiae]|uniref:Metallophosphoesterase n=1 Tax=Paenibacillus spongiae TaxID=2909671 RepID=A0ABY5S2N2_9BACL|nr:metallophosphoesterase [Paenibacillus spongiae]UVI27914.1 metallophosphoesterase [Paenibacillus spongiae]